MQIFVPEKKLWKFLTYDCKEKLKFWSRMLDSLYKLHHSKMPNALILDVMFHFFTSIESLVMR